MTAIIMIVWVIALLRYKPLPDWFIVGAKKETICANYTVLPHNARGGGGSITSHLPVNSGEDLINQSQTLR